MDQPGFSLLNPVVSLNFDLPVSSSIHVANEEEEAAEDERIKEKELQDLLTNAFDDLIEDDDGNEEDRSSFIDDHDSHLSNDHYYRKPHWETKSAPCKQHLGNEVCQGGASERSVKFQQDKSDSLNSNCSSGNTENDRSGGSQHGEDWERRYYLDHWEGEEEYMGSDRHNSNLETIKTNRQNGSTNTNNVEASKGNQKLGFFYKPADLGLQNGSENINYHGQNGNAEHDDLQRKFFTANGEISSMEAEMQRLGILYAARGREIERLQQELETAKDKATKEFQILKRYLAKTKEEKEECAANLEENRTILSAAKQAMCRLEGESRALEMQLKSVSENREELFQKLQSAESTIENLHAQLKELSKSENMVRAKEQHVTILNSMQDKHNNETYELKVKIDELKENLSYKEEIVEDIKRQLTRVEHEYDQAKMEKAETVNRLIKALEESQRECQRLVKAGANETIVDDDLVKSLKNQLSDTKRELEVYVTAAKLQILKADQQSSNNGVQKSVKVQSQDGLVSSLKGEVERSLACLQAKNEQVQKLQASHQSVAANATLMQEKTTFAEQELRNANRKIEELTKKLDAANVNKAGNYKDVKEHLERLEKHKNIANAEIIKKDARVRDLENSKRELSNLVQQLKEELAGLTAHYEEDGRKAVETCRDACLALHQDAIRSKQDEMRKQLQLIQEEYALEANKLCQELDDVKTSYVKVCEEKEVSEQRWNADKTNEIKNLMKEWENNKRTELQALNEQLQKINNELVNERKAHANFDKRLSGRIKEVKQVWKREQDLLIQEKVLVKVKEELRQYMSDRSNIAKDEEDQQVEQIRSLEERVKASEAAWKQHLTNQKLKMEEENKKALVELSLRKDQLLQDNIQALITEKSKEKESALMEAETRVAAELETFLSEQKERFVMALKNMQASHAKEKSDVLHQCETKLTKVKEDYEKLLSFQRETQRQANDERAVSDSEEIDKLKDAIVSLEERLQRKDEDKARIVAQFNKLLNSRSKELEEAKSTIEQRTATAFIREQKETLIGPQNNEAIAILRANLVKAEEDTADLKARVEVEERKHQAMSTKYRTLKDKLKKYHRYIHSKEREFADTLTKLMERNNELPDRISAIRAEVVDILDAKIQELHLKFLLTLPAENGRDGRLFLQSQESKKSINNEADQLRKHYAESIQKIQDDVLTFLSDCSKKVTTKIQDEMAQATWLMAERLVLAKSTVDTLKNEMDGSVKPVEPVEESSITKPSVIPVGSSGHGTMVGSNSDATQPDGGEIFRGVTIQTFNTRELSLKEQHVRSKGIAPLKYWSSTPFANQGSAQWVANDRPSLGLTSSTKARIVAPFSGISPMTGKLSLTPSPDSLSTGTWHSNGRTSAGSGDQAIPERLRNAVVHQQLPINQEASGSLMASFAPLQPQLDESRATSKPLSSSMSNLAWS